MDQTPTPFYWGEEGWCTRVPCVWGKRVALRNLIIFLLRQGPPCFPCWLSRRAHRFAGSTFHLLSAGTSTKITDAGYTSQLFFFLNLDSRDQLRSWGLQGMFFSHTMSPPHLPFYETVSLAQAGLGLPDRPHTGNPAPTSQLLG